MSTSNKINIVFILADDLAVWAVGCYGNAEILTPNLDRVATTGVRFENFFVRHPDYGNTLKTSPKGKFF